eukprot:UN17407
MEHICCQMANLSTWRHFPQMVLVGYMHGHQKKVICKKYRASF